MRIGWIGVAVVLVLVWGARGRGSEPVSEPEPESESESESELESEPEPSDDPAEDEDHQSQGTTVVSRRVAEDTLDALRTVDLIGPEQLRERRPRTVPEALNEMPGIYVQKTNHGGGSPIVRGRVGIDNLMLIDGVRLNNALYRTGPIQYLNTVDSYSLERIEVLRGPGSVLYGSDAMGGVLELVTRDPYPPELGATGRWAPLLAGRGATCDWERSGRAAMSYATSEFGLIGGATLRAFGDLRGGGDVGVQRFSGYQEIDWDAKLRLSKAGSHRLTVLYQGTRLVDAGRSDMLAQNRQLTFYDNGRDLLYAAAVLRLRPIHTRLTLTPSWHRQAETRDKLKFADDTHDLQRIVSLERARDVVHTVGGSARFDTRLLARRLDLMYGVEYYHDAVTRSEAWEGPAEGALLAATPEIPAGARYDTFGAFALVTGTPIRTPTWVELVTYGGVRASAFGAHAPGSTDRGDVDFRLAGGTGAAGVRLRQRGAFNVGLGWDQGFRAPNLAQIALVGPTGQFYEISNPELGPERADTLELSGRFEVGPVRIGAAGYVSFLRDAIVRVPTEVDGQAEIEDRQVVHAINAGQGRVVGVEGELQVQLPFHFSLGADATWTRGDYEVLDAGWVPLTRIPPLFGTARLRFAPPVRGIFVEFFAQGSLKQDRLSPQDLADSRIPEGGTPGWWTLNLRGGVRPVETLQISLAATNLTDAAYKTHGSGIYAAGFDLMLAVELIP